MYLSHFWPLCCVQVSGIQGRLASLVFLDHGERKVTKAIQASRCQVSLAGLDNQVPKVHRDPQGAQERHSMVDNALKDLQGCLGIRVHQASQEKSARKVSTVPSMCS